MVGEGTNPGMLRIEVVCSMNKPLFLVSGRGLACQQQKTRNSIGVFIKQTTPIHYEAIDG